MRIGPWILLMAALGCKGGEDDAATDDTGNPNKPQPTTRTEYIVALLPTANVAHGKEIYEATPGCAECHLVDGSGTSQFPPLTERLPLIDDLRIAQVMIEGIPASRPGGPYMPPYGADWPNQDIADVIAYCRSAFEPAR